jgi:hypothetical protein
MEPRTTEALMDAMFWLVAGFNISGATREQFAATLAQSDDLALAQEEREPARTRLSSVLSAETLVTTYKAFDLLTEYDEVFLDGRIVTDIRPVFKESSISPAGAVIVHTLKVTYGKGHDHFDHYVALDDADLAKLQKIVTRAIEKAAALRQVLQRTGLADLTSKAGT